MISRLEGDKTMSRSETEWRRPPKLPNTHFVDNIVYSDKDIFQKEIENIYKKVWTFTCHESELPNPHDFRTATVAGIPLVLLRGKDRVIRTFYNVCSHRGATLVREPRGNARMLTCFFHLWSYDDLGKCVSITRDEAYSSCQLEKQNLALREVKTEISHGLVFVNLDDTSVPLEKFLGSALENFDEILGGTEYEIFHFNRTLVHANWKMFHETNMDSYHEFMHWVNRQTSLKAKNYYEREVKLYDNGHCTMDPLHAEYGNFPGWEQRDKYTIPGAIPGEFRFVDLFPNTTVVSRSTVIRIDTSIPIAPDKVLIEWRGIAPKGENSDIRSERVKHFIEFWGPFGRNTPEDIIAVEEIYRTFRNQASPYSIHAREENMKGQDDAPTRWFFSEWSKLMGSASNDPLNG